MVKKKIVLISLYEYESFGIRTLHSFIRRGGHEVHSIFLKKVFLDDLVHPSQKELKLLIDKIIELKPNLVGISIISSFFQLSKQLTRLIKESTKVPVIWGGVHPTICPEECIKETDYICRGEGEYPIVELLENPKRKDIKNIWINNNGKIIKNDLRDFIDLDRIPPPDWSNENKYYINNDRFEERELSDRITYRIMSSRGCPFDCTYCCNHTLKKIHEGNGKYVRRISVDRIIKELTDAKERFPKLNLIVFKDDVFTVDKKWVLEFAEKYRENIDIPFSVLVHPRFADEETITALSEAGLRSIRMGIQSGSESMLKDVFKRTQKNKEVISAFRLFKKNKIHPHCDVLLDNPFETEEDKIKTLNLLLELPRPFTLYFFSLIYFPHTELTERALKENKIGRNDLEPTRTKAFHNWRMHINLENEKENRFYYTLYILTQMPIPRSFLRFLSKRRYLKNHPGLITFLKYTQTFNFVKPALKSLCLGDLSVLKKGFNTIKRLR